MKIIIAFIILICSSLAALGQNKNENLIVAKTDSPALFEKSGAGLAFAMTEEEYRKIMKQLSLLPNYVEIKRKPSKLTSEASFGRGLVINGKNIGWIIDDNEKRGYIFYADWNADGDLTNDKPIRFNKIDDTYQLLYRKILTQTVGDQKQNYQYDLKIVVAQHAPPGETEKKLGIKYYDSTIRRGVLNIEGRQIAFGLIGTGGIYDTKYNTLYFDLNGDNDFDIKNRYSAERYKTPEKYINIADKTYEFSVDHYGRDLKLKLLPEKLTARVDLSTGYQAPDFSFKDIDGNPHQLSDFRGKIVLLDFWGTWCAPCVAEAPQLASAYKKLKGKGFEIISLAKEDTIEDLHKFIDKKEMNWTHTQLQEDLSKLYRIDRYPTYFLLDKNGKIISNDLNAGETLYKKVEEMLNN